MEDVSASNTDTDTSEAGPPARPPISNQEKRQRRRTKKLQAMVNTMRREGWSFAQFLAAWVGTDDADSRGLTIRHRRYSRVGKRRRAFLNAVMDNPHIRGLVVPAGTFAAELDRLVQEPYFSTFDRTSSIENLDFKVAFQSIQDVAPSWHATLLQLLGNQRAHRASYHTGGQKAGIKEPLVRRAYAITSMIYSSRAKKRSTFFTSIVDIYLMGSGVKRRVFETLSGFGLCHGYHSANRIMNSIAEEAEVC
jgi:hypothetical protein